MKDEFEAENIVQNTFEKLWVRIEHIKVETVKSYLYKIAYHEMIDVIRRKGRYLPIENANSIEVVNHEYDNVVDYVNKALDRLPNQ